MRALIDDEGTGRHLDLVGAEQEEDVERARCDHAGDVEAAFARHEAEIEPADARGRRVQHAKTVPAVLDDAERTGRLGRHRQDRLAIGTGQGALPDQQHRLLPIGRGMIDETGERLRPCAEMGVVIGQVDLLADQAEGEIAAQPALADARVQDRRLLAGIGADDHQRIRLLDPGDAGIEDVAGAAELRMQLGAVLTAIEIGRPERGDQALQRVHLLDRGEIAGDRADLLGLCRLHLLRDQREGLGPGGRAQRAVLADIGSVEPLCAQAVDDVAGLVGDPLLIHRLIQAGQDAHDLLAAGIDADGRADGVHHVDRLRLGQLPGPGLVLVGLGGQRTDRAEIDDVALELRGHRLLEIGGDLHVLAAPDGAEVLAAGDFGGEADAARALDAARHRGLDQRADILVLDRALVLGIARGVDAIGHRLVLQVALAALVADRAIQRVVDEEELHHPLARLLDHGRLGRDDRRLAIGAGAQVAHADRTRRLRLGRAALHLDEAHAAVAGNREPLMEAEARHLGTRRLAGLQERVFGRNVDLDAVDEEFGHVNISRNQACARYRL